MSFDWDRIERDKQATRSKLAALPIAEKLRMLDALRERQLLLRQSKRIDPPPAPGRS